MEKLDIVQIGKNGITSEVIQEIKTHLKNKKDVKIKFLKSFIEGKDRKIVKDKLLLQLNKTGKLIGNTLVVNWRSSIGKS